MTVKFWPGTNGVDGAEMPTTWAEEGIMEARRVVIKKEAAVVNLGSILEVG